MKTFTFYEYRQVKMYTKDTLHIEAESLDEAKNKLKNAVKNGDTCDIHYDFEYDYESVQDIPNTSEYYQVNKGNSPDKYFYYEEYEDITKEIK